MQEKQKLGFVFHDEDIDPRSPLHDYVPLLSVLKKHDKEGRVGAFTPESMIQEHDARKLLGALVCVVLPVEEEQVISRRFALNGQGCDSWDEIATELNFTVAKVCELEESAFEHLGQFFRREPNARRDYEILAASRSLH